MHWQRAAWQWPQTIGVEFFLILKYSRMFTVGLYNPILIFKYQTDSRVHSYHQSGSTLPRLEMHWPKAALGGHRHHGRHFRFVSEEMVGPLRTVFAHIK